MPNTKLKEESLNGSCAKWSDTWRARELAKVYLKAPEVTRRNTRLDFIQLLKERIVREGGYGLLLEGASALDLMKSTQAQTESCLQKGKVS